MSHLLKSLQLISYEPLLIAKIERRRKMAICVVLDPRIYVEELSTVKYLRMHKNAFYYRNHSYYTDSKVSQKDTIVNCSKDNLLLYCIQFLMSKKKFTILKKKFFPHPFKLAIPFLVCPPNR